MPDEWIRQWGDPTLRELAAPVARVDDLLRRQVERMRRALAAADGAGLAATQVGLLRRLFVYRVERDGPVEVLVNPRVVARSEETELFAEGCLSFLADGILTLDRAEPHERRRAIAALLAPRAAAA